VKIFLISDIHTERAHKRFDPEFDYPCLRFDYPVDADVIVLAGDIGEWKNGLEWARHRFLNKEIIYVLGNHEYYRSDLTVLDELRSKAKELGIHLLENDSVIIGGVRFLGATLWTNFNNFSAVEVEKAQASITDYSVISCKEWLADTNNSLAEKLKLLPIIDNKYKLFTPAIAYLLHKRSLKWLESQLLTLHNGKTVIVTHHAPSLHSCRTKVNYSYASNLNAFIRLYAQHMDLWCHGHIHAPIDYEISGVRIVSNPKGYPHEDNGQFISNLLINI